MSKYNKNNENIKACKNKMAETKQFYQRRLKGIVSEGQSICQVSYKRNVERRREVKKMGRKSFNIFSEKKPLSCRFSTFWVPIRNCC